MIHNLKTWPKYFEAIRSGDKTFEMRSTHDRIFSLGDTLVLQEFIPEQGVYTGKQVKVTVTYVLSDFIGLQDGFVILGFKKPKAAKASAFKPPTLEMATQYFISIGSNSARASTFVDHFKSNGWKVGGKTLMVDWEAAARNFIKNDFNKSTFPIKSPVNGSIHQLV